MHTDFKYESLKRRDHFTDLGAGGKIILKCILKQLDVKM
jgi:hypothetical protein